MSKEKGAMNMKKRIIGILLVITLGIALCSCGTKQSNVNPSPESGVSAPTESVSITHVEGTATPIESVSTTPVENAVNPAKNTVQGSEPKPAESKAVESKPDKMEQAFPFKDDAGSMRYRLVINGNEVETKNPAVYLS